MIKISYDRLPNLIIRMYDEEYWMMRSPEQQKAILLEFKEAVQSISNNITKLVLEMENEKIII